MKFLEHPANNKTMYSMRDMPTNNGLDREGPYPDLKMRKLGDVSVSQKNWSFKISWIKNYKDKNYLVNNQTGTCNRSRNFMFFIMKKNIDANDFKGPSKFSI